MNTLLRTPLSTGVRTSLLACGLLLVLGGVVGCGEEPPPVAESDTVPSAEASNQEKSSGARGVIPEYQLNALRKAGGVEAQLLDAEAKRREKFDALGH